MSSPKWDVSPRRSLCIHGASLTHLPHASTQSKPHPSTTIQQYEASKSLLYRAFHTRGKMIEFFGQKVLSFLGRAIAPSREGSESIRSGSDTSYIMILRLGGIDRRCDLCPRELAKYAQSAELLLLNLERLKKLTFCSRYAKEVETSRSIDVYRHHTTSGSTYEFAAYERT